MGWFLGWQWSKNMLLKTSDKLLKWGYQGVISWKDVVNERWMKSWRTGGRKFLELLLDILFFI
jgi:hypothetical protein